MYRIATSVFLATVLTLSTVGTALASGSATGGATGITILSAIIFVVAMVLGVLVGRRYSRRRRGSGKKGWRDDPWNM